MDDRVLPFVLQSLSLPNISKLAGVLISSRESAISDVVEATGVLPDDAKQKLLAVCSKAALLPALLDGHAHMGRVAGAGWLVTAIIYVSFSLGRAWEKHIQSV